MSELPEHKHSQRELGEMRARNAFQSRPPVQHIAAQRLATPLVIIAYLIAIAAVALAWKEYYLYGFGCAGFTILFSLFIFVRKKRSHHHAAFLLIISILVLVLGGVYYKQQRDAEQPAPNQPRYL